MKASSLVWKPAPKRLLLGDEDVHVWLASLNQPAAVVLAHQQILSPDELDRAAKYHFQKDGKHFVVARATLRFLLASYLQSEPARLRFRLNEYGKPRLDAETEGEALRFNLSHSQDLALYAVARTREVGIDLEYIRQDFYTRQIAERFFSVGEVLALDALPVNLQTEGFFRCWTRKEAYIKARGEGLSLPLEQFDVSLSPDEPVALLKVRTDPTEVSRWSLMELTPAPGYMAAIAIEGTGFSLSCFTATF